ncbi:kinesin motor domain-containing protein, partial [Pelagophyceae sp. CCMP2097]
FDFDRVHQGESQKALYESAVAPLVDGVLHGFNATVLAYGQSASGKTYTMGCGADLAGDDEGIVQRAAQQLLAGAVTNAEWDDAQTAEVHMAYVEIYNEDLRDLLAPPAPAKPEVALAVRETPQGEVVVVGATEIRCRTIDDVRLLLRTGAARRATGSTALNERSSRSHAIVTLTVTKTQLVSEPDADEPRQFSVVKSKIHCADPRPASVGVDLAGSERQKKSRASNDRLKEGIAINVGLLALAKVITALCDKGRGPRPHVPYRDSKLTRLLQDALGGTARTVMIACVSPDGGDATETLQTLSYAARARRVR